MINKIFLDVDGVLADFGKGAFKIIGQEYDYHHPALRSWWWNEYFNIDFSVIDAGCGTEFWHNLEWMFDGRTILSMVLTKFDFDRTWLLTTPMPNLESASGKMMWVHDNIPEFEKKTIITRAPKAIFADKHALLIDDNNDNVSKFKAAGGRVILVPRPWNKLSFLADVSADYVKAELERFL